MTEKNIGEYSGEAFGDLIISFMTKNIPVQNTFMKLSNMPILSYPKKKEFLSALELFGDRMPWK